MNNIVFEHVVKAYGKNVIVNDLEYGNPGRGAADSGWARPAAENPPPCA